MGRQRSGEGIRRPEEAAARRGCPARGRRARGPLAALSLAALLAAAGAARPLPAQETGAGADAGRARAVPSPADVLGHELGERFTPPEDAVAYAERLARDSDQALAVRYGETAAGRPLLLLVFARPDRLAGLEALLERNARLADPALAEAEAGRLARENPAVAWLSYGVHGDESSSTEAALWTAHDLATGAPGTEGLLDSLVVVIDPMLNPDGRARYVSWYRGVRGAEPNPEPRALEHRPPWPAGRYNHYLFDLNRDWAWATQIETRARLAQWHRFRPQVHVDFHEMSWRSTYFFFPPTPPINPFYPEYTLRWARYFGDRLADAFDRAGWLYYTGERFDLFYPGYGDSWPSLWGAIGMTYEQAGGGAAGLAIRRPGGDLLTLADRAARHRAAGLETLRATAARKTALLEEFAAFHREAAASTPDLLLVPGPDAAAADALAALLDRQGLRVERAGRAFRAAAEPHAGFAAREAFPEGTLRVPGRQPGALLARTLLAAETPFDPESRSFSYDLTAWALPYGYGVEAHTAERIPDAAWSPLSGAADEAAASRPAPAAAAPYGWLVAPGLEAAGPLYRYLALGGTARVLGRATEAGVRDWPAGTWFLPASDSAAAWLGRSGAAAHATPVASGRGEGGVDLGTEEALVPIASRIAVRAGEGVAPPSFGQVWYLLERELEIPFDALPEEALEASALTDYDVLVLPAGRPLPEARREDVEGWLRAGGTLVAVGGAARWAAELAEVPVRADTADAEAKTDEEAARRRGLRTREERRVDRWEESVTGVVLPVESDPEHPLAWGAGAGNTAGRWFVLHREDLRFEPSEDHEAVAWFPTGVRAVSGVLSDRKAGELAMSAWLVTKRVGEGRVVLFADDPLFRLFWRSTQLSFVQALLLGPAMR